MKKVRYLAFALVPFGTWYLAVARKQAGKGNPKSHSATLRHFCKISYHDALDKIVLFGGRTARDTGQSDETWIWDGSSWQQFLVSGPSARDGHKMAFDTAGNRIVLFGGWYGSPMDDTWKFDGSTWIEIDTTGPARSFFAMCFDQNRNETMLFGGDIGGPGSWDETWVYGECD